MIVWIYQRKKFSCSSMLWTVVLSSILIHTLVGKGVIVFWLVTSLQTQKVARVSLDPSNCHPVLRREPNHHPLTSKNTTPMNPSKWPPSVQRIWKRTSLRKKKTCIALWSTGLLHQSRIRNSIHQDNLVVFKDTQEWQLQIVMSRSPILTGSSRFPTQYGWPKSQLCKIDE